METRGHGGDTEDARTGGLVGRTKAHELIR
jgi:hypothetical protein